MCFNVCFDFRDTFPWANMRLRVELLRNVKGNDRIQKMVPELRCSSVFSSEKIFLILYIFQ